jgi:hypothetical protein
MASIPRKDLFFKSFEKFYYYYYDMPKKENKSQDEGRRADI